MNIDDRPIIFCFRNDLRISDNPGLTAACETGQPVLTCFIQDDIIPQNWCRGSASRWWLHHSLCSLQVSLKKIGGHLVLRTGSWIEEMLQLVSQVHACAVYWSRAYEPHAVKAEIDLHHRLLEKGIVSKRFGGYLLFEPEKIRTRLGDPFKVFTPFWKACQQQQNLSLPLDKPNKINFYQAEVFSESLKNLCLLPTNPDWSAGLYETWKPGEEGAWKQLDNFYDEIANYKHSRDFPAISGTSKLSPHLHFGEISPRQIWHYFHSGIILAGKNPIGVESFFRELGWREFCYHLLFHWPYIPEQPFRKQFVKFPWKKDTVMIKAWQQGKTGFPLVDAGMRELWHTGWMHNRVRMIAASLLVKNMLQPWQIGEKWFWDTLVDADLANNAAGWQWVAGSGADAAPYFRIFNPVSQSEKFDSEGIYIRKWVPELYKLSNQYIHAPWAAPAAELKKAGIEIGMDYPKPVVDHLITRKRALDAHKRIKQ